ncbi:beta strand repeat-containing protein [Thalassolituus oleivorans]|uniref:beta strand repeat-containing protein n=1 Tax=Thalassolituus oleivorans TaxID=187493 RepID=UPI00042DC6FA|nr:DUF11 domain-containing protein [Thalassolituus oleivorans]AHK17701.1 hypothetical protein R615_12000 [Thalassolituus oleivorans R6-15]
MLLLCFLVAPISYAQDIVLRKSFAGNLSFALTGNTMRNGTNGCGVLTSSSATLTIPTGSTLKAAYLYWSGSGSPDTSVSLNGASVSAAVSYTETGNNETYYSAKADVTGRISASTSTYTVTGLTFSTADAYCSTEGAYGGWALLAVYENNSEPLRVVNLFDGFRVYWGSSITLTPNNFVVAPNPASLGGKHAHITWEGDSGNSDARNGISESLIFNGTSLTSTNNPSGNQFNSYSNAVGATTSGVDLDVYNIGSFLTAGSRSVATTYSSGQDQVFLSAEIISIPNEPVSDLSLTVTAPTTAVARGSNVSYQFSVKNDGPIDEPTGTTLTIPLNNGVTFISATGTDWSCTNTSSQVLCTYNKALTDNVTAPALTLVVGTAGATTNSVDGTAVVEGFNFDNNEDDNSVAMTVALADPNLSTSIKSVLDVNGGTLQPGDTLRFTIDINNTSDFNAEGIRLTDNMPAAISSFEVVRQPVDSVNNSTAAPTGTNSAGVVIIDNLMIAAQGTEEVVIDAIVSSSASQGTSITNSAIIGNSTTTYTITAPTISVASTVSNGEIVLRSSLAGNLSFKLTGNSMRSSSNECNALTSSSASLSIPSGSTVKAAYLYWSGSGSTDNSVNLNGAAVTAGYTYNETSGNQTFYSARADITSQITGTGGTYTVTGLTFNTSDTYCNNAVVYGGWSILAIYENASEPLRVVNLYDGFKSFTGSSITLSPNNFVIAQNAATLGGQHAHITWEGDAGNSQSTGGFSEALIFEGNSLTDANNPAGNQFNSYSNTVAAATSGVDIDTYQIGSYLTPGATSVSTTYSSGQDKVFLTAEIISVPNELVSDLHLLTTAPAKVSRGANINYSFTARNDGPSTAPIGSEIRIPLNDGATFISASGTDWTCTSTLTEVVCTYAQSINNGASSTPLAIQIGTTNTTQATTVGSATLSGSNFDNDSSDNSDDLAVILQDANLSTSTKTVTDLNGGLLEPGDTLRYTITLKNSSNFNATNLSLTDNIPALISSYTLITTPAGSINNSANAPSGTNATGLVQIDNISISAAGSVTIVLEAVVSSGAQNGNSITNTAIAGNNAQNYTFSSPTVSINNVIDGSGNKPLYLHSNLSLTRVADTSNDSVSYSSGQSRTWIISPALQTNVNLNYNAAIPLTLFLQNSAKSGRNVDNERTHSITATLERSRSGTVTTIATVTQNVALLSAGNPNTADTIRAFELGLAISNAATLQTNDVLQLKISQSYSGNSTSSYSGMNLYFAHSNVPSAVKLTSNTVINVNSISVFDAPYPAGNELTSIDRGQQIYFRSQVSDPFGFYDINGATLTVANTTGDLPISEATLSPVASSGAINTYEYPYLVPTTANGGEWSITVKANEGFEGTVFHSRTEAISLRLPPELILTKTMNVLSDPLNGSTNPKAIPGAEVAYQLNVVNQGEGESDPDSIQLIDHLAANTPLFVGDFANGSPIELADGTPPSTLTLTFTSLDSATDDIDFSNDGGTSFTYVPNPDADGFDPLVTDIRITPKGTMPGSVGGGSPQFTLIYKVKVQ